MKYTLEELQQLYGRKDEAVSRNAKPLNLERLPEHWKNIMVEAINFVNTSYQKDSTPLSVRQIHYYLVSQTHLNYLNDIKHSSYLTTYILQARIGNLIGWHMITEEESTVAHVAPSGADPETAIKEALEYAKFAAGKNPWDEMHKNLLIISEKRELGPQLETIANRYFVRLVCTRGYGMWSRLYTESQRLLAEEQKNNQNILLFVTDHDPSGLDLNRFGAAILKLYWKHSAIDQRVMLMDTQIEQYKLPPNPAKIKDPRAKWYIKKFNKESWEVDALGKEQMQTILEQTIRSHIDWSIWNSVMKENQENMAETEKIAREYLDKLDK